MPQQEIIPQRYEEVSDQPDAGVRLRSTELGTPFDFTFEVIKSGLFRTTFSSTSHPLPPLPSAKRPASSTSDIDISTGTASKTFNCPGGIEAQIAWDGVPLVSVGFKDSEPLHKDLPFRSYTVDGTGVCHYSRYYRGSLHVGLGEKASPMDLSNRNFTLSATDCFGYDALRTDPMYKHIPLLIKAGPEGCVGTFSTSHARGSFSVGSEMDGMWGFYKVYRQDHGGLEEYTMVGRTIQEVVTLYAELVGFPLLVPRWAYGYLAGGMKYSMLDEPRACDALMEFAAKLEKYDIPCSGFQMSSGYTIAETEPKTRNVFTWNRHRFPDPEGFVHEYRKKGIRLIANIKPYVLANHPEYRKLVDSGALFTDPLSGQTGVTRLWSAGGGESGEGGHIDFTSKAGYDWWYNGVKGLREIGIDCMWNDNNEYTVPSDDWINAVDEAECLAAAEAVGETRRDIGLWGRALNTELMGKSSHDALLEVAPTERPFVLTRSATAGTMRYCCSSWSGDNVTSWEGYKGANAIHLTAGMCLLQNYGSDIGGFEGPQPTPELLVRWVQTGIHSPRFAINCFKTGSDNKVGDVIEPWMYPEVLSEIRKAICRRYELIPYLYGLGIRSHFEAVPAQRWVGWGYESDPEVWSSKALKAGDEQYWLGDTLMIGGVYEPDVSEAKVYLPKRSSSNAGFLNTNAPYQYLPAGQWHTISSPWKTSIPVLARIGGAVPVGKARQTVAPGDKVNEANLPEDDYRGVEIFPSPEDRSNGTVYETSWMEDDGISTVEVAEKQMAKFTIRYSATPKQISVWFKAEAKTFEPPWVVNGLTFILPVGDARPVVGDDGCSVESRRRDESGRERYQVVGASVQ
jgi:alpha-glucosidase (family GH31 glycosyl hydrolase)